LAVLGVYGGEEAVAALRDGLDEAGFSVVVAEGDAELADDVVDALVALGVDAVGPKEIGELRAGDELVSL
jgi:hypothetical protein